MSFPHVIFGDLNTGAHKQNTTDKRQPLGTALWYPDGRHYRYALCGGTTLIVGNLTQGKAVVSGDYTDVVTDVAPAIGDISLSLTTTTTTAAAYYNDGWVIVNKGAALEDGYIYKLKETGANIVLAASAGNIVYLNPEDPIRVAGTTAQEVGLIPNSFNGVVVSVATNATGQLIGVAQAPITNAKYGFVQTFGMCAVNSAASQVVGDRLVNIAAAAGRVGIEAETSGVGAYIGEAMSVPTTAGEYGAIFLRLD